MICLSISIHAPQWGATNNRYQTGVHESISIHAPQWGATSTTIRVPRPPNYFNPRTPVGCDGRQGARLPVLRISIHAPQWGATSPSVSKLTPDPDFNPRTPVGCDVAALTMAETVSKFQSTHPSGVRQDALAYRLPFCIFQSTHPSGVRLFEPSNYGPKTLFQSTHPSGVRLASPRLSAMMGGISIHAPQWGATAEYLGADNFRK